MSITAYGYTEIVCEECGEKVRYDTCSEDDALGSAYDDGWVLYRGEGRKGPYCPKCKWKLTSRLPPCPECGGTPGIVVGKDGCQIRCKCGFSDGYWSDFGKSFTYWNLGRIFIDPIFGRRKMTDFGSRPYPLEHPGFSKEEI